MDCLPRRLCAALGVAVLSACSHSAPFENPDRGTDQPFAPGDALRLTYNAGTDRAAAFLPDGRGVLFAFQRPGTRDGDQCLGLLPAGGGTALDEWCPRSAGSRDSTDRFDEPSALDAATLLYTRASRPIGAVSDAWSYLGTAPLADPEAYAVRVRFPFTAASGRLHLAPSFPVSLGDGRIAYLAQERVSAAPTPDDDPRLVEVGVEVAIASLADAAPPAPVAGTVRATSLAPGGAAGELLFTRPADRRVHVRRADGTVEVLHEFAAVAREPSLAAGRLVAVVGGNVGLWFEGVPATRTVQVDDGGPLVLVELATGAETVLSPPGTAWRRPRLAPDGGAVVAQGAGGTPDIFRLKVP
jgi:hypothetical protein